MLATLAAFAGQAAVVYKWTDSGGLIHYSDQPVPGAEKIYTGTSQAKGTGSPPTNSDTPASGERKDPSVLGYTDFAIVSPAPEQTFFGDEPINVALTLNPAIKANHTLIWHLNGKDLEDLAPDATQFKLPHLDRGTYAIAATVTDPQTGESRSTDSVTFFVRQPSALSPQHQKH